MYEMACKRVYKSKRCVLFMTFRPSQHTLFMARRNWVPLALNTFSRFSIYFTNVYFLGYYNTFDHMSILSLITICLHDFYCISVHCL